ncbi:uncharacterized protein [Manis javanica]|uniref:uncharacterized protein n=1 Tax=Manis javanica TaxID=9974 RepID=UPI003C6D707D
MCVRTHAPSRPRYPEATLAAEPPPPEPASMTSSGNLWAGEAVGASGLGRQDERGGCGLGRRAREGLPDRPRPDARTSFHRKQRPASSPAPPPHPQLRFPEGLRLAARAQPPGHPCSEQPPTAVHTRSACPSLLPGTAPGRPRPCPRSPPTCASSCSLSLDEPRLIHNQKRFTLHVTELLFTYERTAGRRPTHWASREYGSPTYQPDTWKPRRCPSIDKAPSINQINAGHESVYSAPFHLPLRSQRNLVLCCCPRYSCNFRNSCPESSVASDDSRLRFRASWRPGSSLCCREQESLSESLFLEALESPSSPAYPGPPEASPGAFRSAGVGVGEWQCVFQTAATGGQGRPRQGGAAGPGPRLRALLRGH